MRLELGNQDLHTFLDLFCNNITHRERGPAITYSSGLKEWYLNGILQHVH